MHSVIALQKQNVAGSGFTDQQSQPALGQAGITRAVRGRGARQQRGEVTQWSLGTAGTLEPPRDTRVVFRGKEMPRQLS